MIYLLKMLALYKPVKWRQPHQCSAISIFMFESAHGIATTGEIKMRSSHREKLLAIRRGEFSYSTLSAEAEK